MDKKSCQSNKITKHEWLVATIRYQLKQKGENSNWREIVRTMNTQKCVILVLTSFAFANLIRTSI